VNALVQAGGYAMIMGFQFYPWTHKELADKIRDTLGLPVDTPKRIEQGTMQRFENWIVSPRQMRVDDRKVDRLLAKMEAAYVREKRPEPGPINKAEFESE
jgi:hypothetical protein